MTLVGLSARNALRNRLRTVLTVFGVGVAVLAFVMLRTVIWAQSFAAEAAAKDRVVTRHKVTFVMPIPKRYVDTIAQQDGVKSVTYCNWFGGKDPKHDKEFFAALACDAATNFEVYDEMALPPADLAAFKEDRRGAVVGDVLAKKLGWKVGDKIVLSSQIYPGDWEFTVRGIYTATRKSVDRSTFVFHWNYLNESLPERRRDTVGWVVSRIAPGKRPAEVGVGIDRVFDERDTQTLSQDEGAFNASFLGMFAAVLKALNIVSIVILGIMALILGNTIAMSARERTKEYGTLRAIGFLPKHLAIFVLGESVTIGVLGGVLGVALAYPIVQEGLGRFIEENMGSIFPYFRIPLSTAVVAVLLAVGMSVAAALIPAYRAASLRVVDALRRIA